MNAIATFSQSSLVYDPKSGSNEEDSEALFKIFTKEAGLSHSDASAVSAYIIATKKHDVSDWNDSDLRAFIDLDMGVMGRERNGYLTYASQVFGCCTFFVGPFFYCCHDHHASMMTIVQERNICRAEVYGKDGSASVQQLHRGRGARLGFLPILRPDAKVRPCECSISQT